MILFDEFQYYLITQSIHSAFAECFASNAIIGNYTQLINSMNFSTEIEVHDNSYAGDSFYMLKHGDFYGILVFGWGSCSGCDAFKSCTSYDDIEDLRKQLFHSITWGDANETLAYVNEHDWQGDFSWGEKSQNFIQKVIVYFQ